MQNAKDCPLNGESPRNGLWRFVPILLAFIPGLFGAATLADAQGVDCGRLQAQIGAIDQANARNNPYFGAAQKQRTEIERTRAYAQSIGCDRRQFLFFGGSPPPQCPALQGRIQQMQTNLSQLEANAHAGGNSAQRQDLLARYNAYCREQRQPGFFETLFGGGQSQQPPADISPEDAAAPPGEEDQKPRGGSEAVCVRSCDGGFFPLNYSARHSSSDLADLCKALCPNTEATVYTLVPGQEIKTAVSLDGTPYTELAAALKFQKSFDPACTCHPAGQSWADALAGAERVLGHERKGDIIVTPEKSAEMSRPKPDAAQRGKALQATQPKQPADDIENRDAISAAEVPTASKDSAGIATGEVKNGTDYPEGQGPTADSVGPDGVKRHVRIVGPPL
jgi:hypothetical protein